MSRIQEGLEIGGGAQGGYPATLSIIYNDTWAYDLNTNTWTELNLSIHPTARQGIVSDYDSESDRTILIGGYVRVMGAITTVYHDTWALDYKPNLASAPQNLQITASINAVNLTWQAPSDDGGSSITDYNIYRGTISGDLSLHIQTLNIQTLNITGFFLFDIS